MQTDRWGIDPGYIGCDGQWRATRRETRRALLKAMKATAGGKPRTDYVRVVRFGEPTGLAGPGELRLEYGRTVEIEGELPRDLPWGYHDFHRPRRKAVRLIVTPPSCYLLDGLRLWGWTAQLYALRSAESWGIGDLGDLRRLAEWSAAELGARLIMINPLGAASPGLPQQNSPYYPSSRLFRNPIYLRIPDTPEYGQLAAAGHALNGQRRIERDRVWRLKRAALAQAWQSFPGDPRFDGYCRDQGEPLRQFALFCALSENFQAPWQRWPAGYRHPGSSQVRAFAAKATEQLRFHQWMQWLLDTQLSSCCERLAIMEDLPVGVDPSGADAWVWQDVLAQGVSIGAPPDPFAAAGQDWGLPPFIPHKLREARYEPFIQTIRAAMRHAGVLRLDHVMGLFRLFWVPNGASAAHGAYVRYPVDDLLGILALESHRAHALVVGEDLGTVEDGMREKLAAHNVLSSRVLWFEPEPRYYPQRSMASITTHDLPTIAGIWTGEDVRARQAAHLDPNENGARHMRNCLQHCTGAPDSADPRDVIVRAHERLAEAPSMLVTATLDDALGVPERPNMPSTLNEWPNWSLALPRTLEEFQADPLPRAVAAALRKGSTASA